MKLGPGEDESQLPAVEVASFWISHQCSCYGSPMTLHSEESQIGVRELHDRLSEHLERVEKGEEIVVTRRGKRIALLSPVGVDSPLEDLVARGLIRMPGSPRSPREARVKPTGSVSNLVSEQRR
jgi:prevent-host-death family protein